MMYFVNHFNPPEEIMPPKSLHDAMVLRGETLYFRKGNMILSAESETTEVYLVRRGKLQVNMMAPNGRETIFRKIGEGQCFGELSAIDGSPRSANVVAVTDGSAFWLSQAEFHTVLAENPDIALWFLSQYSHQIRELTDRIYELSNYAVSTRLQCEILRLVMQEGAEDGACIIRRAPTHAEIAARIGTNRESVTREMRTLADQELLIQKGRCLTVHSVARLRTLVADKMQ